MQVMLLPKIPLCKKLSEKIARFSTQKIDPATGVIKELTDGCYSEGDSQVLHVFIRTLVLGIHTISFQ